MALGIISVKSKLSIGELWVIQTSCHSYITISYVQNESNTVRYKDKEIYPKSCFWKKCLLSGV